MKHTPGPWFKDGNFIRQADDSGLIAELYISPNQNDGRNEALTANAKLMAAAPEMYALLSQINTAFYTRTSRKEWLELMEKTKPLLQKARGEL